MVMRENNLCLHRGILDFFFLFSFFFFFFFWAGGHTIQSNVLATLLVLTSRQFHFCSNLATNCTHKHVTDEVAKLAYSRLTKSQCNDC